jgi:EmrB/QacA subfamily drug resistance transporter
MAGVGATVGLLLGGVLTDYLSWRWVFFVNVPIGVAVLFGTAVLAEGRRNDGRLDVPGALLGTGGLLALVYGITRGSESGWTDDFTLASLVGSAVLLVVFIAWQARSHHPMMPLWLFSDRSRAGSYATVLFIGAGMFATFYFLTLFLQLVLGYDPIKAGFAYLPFSFGMGLAAALSSRLVERAAPRLIAGPGLLIAAVGMFWLSMLNPETSYFAQLMPAMFVTAFGLGLSFVPMTLGAVSKVDDQNSGIASALLNTAQQIGGALGLAILSAVATTASNRQLPDAAAALYRGFGMRDPALIQTASDALTYGYSTALKVAAGFFLAGLIVTALAITAGPSKSSDKASLDDNAIRPLT